MINNVYAVFDNKASAFLQPAILPNDQVAIRQFASACRDPQHNFVLFPDDYTIYQVATWNDDIDGGYENTLPPRPVIGAREAALMLQAPILTTGDPLDGQS